MRYLKIFGIYLMICTAMTIYFIDSRAVSEENSKETLSNSSITGQITICNANTQSPEEVINVNDTQENISIVNETDAEYALMYDRERYVSTSHRGGFDRTKVEPPSNSASNVQTSAPTDTINTTSDATGVEKYVPSGRGKVHTIMGWQLITSRSSKQYKLRDAAGETYDENGFGKIGDRFVVAVKPYYGNVGDYIDVYKSNGEIIKCIIGDIKGSDGGGDTYGHADGSIVEFCVDMYRWYGNYNGLGKYISVSEYYPSWTSSSITKILNTGNYWN